MDDDGATGTDTAPRIDFALVAARSWALATELCRRHAGLVVYERRGPEVPCDSLAVYRQGDSRPVVDLNRAGSILVPGPAADRGEEGRQGSGAGSAEASGPEVRTLDLAWPEAFARPAGDAVALLEEAAGLTEPPRRLRTAGHLLTYRLVAAVLAATQDAGRPWSARAAAAVGDGAEARHLFTGFRGAERARADSGPGPEGAYGFWSLLHDGEAQVLLDQNAVLYRRDAEPEDLHHRYEAAGRSMWALAAGLFGRHLG